MGVVFSISTGGTGFTVLHSFAGAASDGAYPMSGGLALSGSTLYGATECGGANNEGTVYSIGTTGSGFAVLHSFNLATDSGYPSSGLLLSGSTLYGQTDYNSNAIAPYCTSAPQP